MGEFRQLNGTELKTRRCLRNTVFVHVPMVLEYSIPKKCLRSCHISVCIGVILYVRVFLSLRICDCVCACDCVCDYVYVCQALY